MGLSEYGASERTLAGSTPCDSLTRSKTQRGRKAAVTETRDAGSGDKVLVAGAQMMSVQPGALEPAGVSFVRAGRATHVSSKQPCRTQISSLTRFAQAVDWILGSQR